MQPCCLQQSTPRQIYVLTDIARGRLDTSGSVTHPLRVLVELVSYLEEIRVARQVPKVYSHRLAVHRDRLNPVINANGRYILGDKLRETKGNDELYGRVLTAIHCIVYSTTPGVANS